jgi:RimJ/RimL family protein N-acetyltransferase
MPDFETERLVLRQWRESDFDDFHAFYNDPALQAVYGKTSRPEVRRQLALFTGHFQLRGLRWIAGSTRSVWHGSSAI